MSRSATPNKEAIFTSTLPEQPGALVAAVSALPYDEAEPLASATVHLGLGNRRGTLDFMRASVGGYSPLASFIAVDPLFDELRKEAELEEIVAELKLPRVCRQRDPPSPGRGKGMARPELAKDRR